MFFNPSASSWKYESLSFDSDVENFHCRLPDYNVTPLVSLPEVAKELGLGHVLVKDESTRLGLPAFKILGASWAIYKAAAASCNIPLTVSLEELGAAARTQHLQLLACTAPLSALRRLCKEKQLNLNAQSVVVLLSTEGAREYAVPG